MDFIRPIEPDRDVEALWRVERTKDEPEEKAEGRRQKADRRRKAGGGPDASSEGPVEGDDGHFHIDVKA